MTSKTDALEDFMNTDKFILKLICKNKFSSQDKTKMENSKGHIILLNMKIYCNISGTKTM